MRPTPSTRASLLLRIRDARDQRAWDEFVQLYAPIIYGHCRARGLQDADASDMLERGGTYTIAVSGHGDGVGDYGFQLWDVPPPDEFSINIGDSVSGEIETPGAVDTYRFTAQAGEKVFFDEEARCCTITWRCVDEDGAEVFGPNPVSTPQDVGAVTLERGGRYTVIVSGFGDGTGPYGFDLRAGEE